MTTNHFNTLEVSPHSSDADIKTSWRKLALKHHPDKGGDKQLFQELNNAYEILRDPEKRAEHA